MSHTYDLLPKRGIYTKYWYKPPTTTEPKLTPELRMRVTFFIYSYFLYFFLCHVLTTIFSSRLLFSSKTGECGDFFYLLLLAYLYSTKEFVEWLLIFAPIIIIVVCNHTRMAKNEDTTAILYLVNFGLKKIILLSLDWLLVQLSSYIIILRPNLPGT